MGEAADFLNEQQFDFPNAGGILEEVLMWTCLCPSVLLQGSKLSATDTAVCRCCPDVSFEQRVFSLPVAVSAAAVLLQKSCRRSMAGGMTRTSLPVTVPSQKWGGLGEERCIQNALWVRPGSPDVVFDHIWDVTDWRRISVRSSWATKRTEKGKAYYSHMWFYGQAYYVRR